MELIYSETKFPSNLNCDEKGLVEWTSGQKCFSRNSVNFMWRTDKNVALLQKHVKLENGWHQWCRNTLREPFDDWTWNIHAPSVPQIYVKYNKPSDLCRKNENWNSMTVFVKISCFYIRPRCLNLQSHISLRCIEEMYNSIHFYHMFLFEIPMSPKEDKERVKQIMSQVTIVCIYSDMQ